MDSWPKQRRDRALDVPHPNSPAGRIFDWSSLGVPHPNSPAGRIFDWSSLGEPHPDSPAGRNLGWRSGLAQTEHQERHDLARQIEEVETCLAKQSDSLRDTLPDGSLRTIYDRHVGQIKGTYNFGKPLDSTAPDLPTLLQKLQIALDWFDPQLHRSSYYQRPGFGVAIGKAKTLWEYGMLQEKKDLLKDIQTLAEPVYEAAKKSIQEQWAEGQRTGKQEELIGKWKMRSLQRVVHAGSAGTGAAATSEQRRSEAPPVLRDMAPEKQKLHWIQIRLVTLPDTAPRKKWWPSDQRVTYADEPFTAEVTDGHKDSALDGGGSSRYEKIPGGTCSWRFTRFFDQIELALKPGPPVKDAKSLAGPTRQ
jgi:hypothetical protein